jgi:DNA-binding CsgD family transcriptional regulator/archaellum biogenesis ATPase FlaH
MPNLVNQGEHENAPKDLDAVDMLKVTTTESEKTVQAKVKKGGKRTLHDILQAQDDPNESIIGNIFQRGHISVFYGESDAGKSQFLQQMALAIVEARPDFMGWDIRAKNRRVVYVATEDIESDVRRVMRRMTANGEERALFHSKLEYILDDDATDGLDVLKERLEKSLDDDPADLVVIDAFLDVMDGNVNDANQVRQTLKVFQRIAKVHSCHVILLTHVSKGKQDKGASKNNILGSMAIEAKARLAIEYKKDPDPMRSDIRHVCIVKGNHLPPEMKGESFEVVRDPDSFKISPTGHRVPVEMLAKQPMYKDPRLLDQVDQLTKEGKSEEKMAQALEVSRDTVRKLKAENAKLKGEGSQGVQTEGSKRVQTEGSQGVQNGGANGGAQRVQKEGAKQAVLKLYDEGRKPTEIADLTGVPRNTVKSYIKRNKAK